MASIQETFHQWKMFPWYYYLCNNTQWRPSVDDVTESVHIYIVCFFPEISWRVWFSSIHMLGPLYGRTAIKNWKKSWEPNTLYSPEVRSIETKPKPWNVLFRTNWRGRIVVFYILLLLVSAIYLQYFNVHNNCCFYFCR